MQIRIGELAKRTGVAPATLRAWQRRYGLPVPRRTDSGYRMYTMTDIELVQRLRRLVDDGIPISEAVRMVRSGDRPLGSATPSPDVSIPASAGHDLEEALVAFDGPAAHAILDDVLARFSTSMVMRDIVLPLLARIGNRYVEGTIGIAHEHYATALLRGRIWQLARNWDHGEGARVVLASAAGDQHDLGLLVFGLALRERGWRITWLGANTPAVDVAEAVDSIGARAAVVAMARRIPPAEELDAIADLARRCPVAIGGGAATSDVAEACSATLLTDDPISAATLDVFATT